MELLIAFIGILVIIGVFVALTFYQTISWGFVTFKFWQWFLLPIFPAIPAITFLQAIGLWLVVSLFKGESSQYIKKDYTDQNTKIVINIISPWTSLLLGWLIKLIIM